MKKADYNKIASFYDKGHVIREKNLKLWINMISEHLTIGDDTKLLDIGCGTGRIALPLAAGLPISVTGADSSWAMLEKAKNKDTDGLVRWEYQDAESLTFPDESFDGVFMSHLLHHLDAPRQALGECVRVLKKAGVVIIRYGAMEQIRDDYRHTFFPETLEIDELRTPSVKAVENWLEKAGLTSINSVEVRQETFENSEQLLDATRHKLTSVLTMISKQAFNEGFKKLNDYILGHPDDPWLLENRLTLSVGYKF